MVTVSAVLCYDIGMDWNGELFSIVLEERKAVSHREWYINGLEQYCSNSIAWAMELLQYCAETSIWRTA